MRRVGVEGGGWGDEEGGGMSGGMRRVGGDEGRGEEGGGMSGG